MFRNKQSHQILCPLLHFLSITVGLNCLFYLSLSGSCLEDRNHYGYFKQKGLWFRELCYKVLKEIDKQRGNIMFPDARDCRMLLILQESIILNPVSSTHSHVAAKYPQIICSEPPTGAHRACCCLHIVGGITRNSGFFLPCLVISCMYHWQNLKGIQSGKCSFRLLTLVIRGIV